MTTPSDESADRPRAGDLLSVTHRAMAWWVVICSAGHTGAVLTSLPPGPAACARRDVMGNPCGAPLQAL